MPCAPLPANLDAETAVLAACLMEEEAYTTASGVLHEDHFSDARHRAIWRALVGLRSTGEEIDPLTLAAELERAGDLKTAGGKDYIGWLIDAVPTAANVIYHARIVREQAERRALILLARRVEAEAMSPSVKPRDIASSIASEVVTVAAVAGARGFRPAGDFVWDVLREIEDRANGRAVPGVATGYTAIDEHIGGLRPGDLAIMAGVPGSGKTALGLNILLNAAMAGVECGIVSAEMTSKGLIERSLANLALVGSGALRKGQLVDRDYTHLINAGGALGKMPLHIDDTPRPEIREVLARLRHLKAKHLALALVVVDFIQLVRCASEDMMALALTNISYDLKGAAKELELAVIATCQVDAAGVEKGETPRPRLHHLRWSQGMREAADFAGLVYRPAMYDPHGDRERMEVSFEKARDLPPFTAVLRWVGKYMRVENHPDHLMARAA
ncbi:MAG TPA: replicative DNA helicase [Gemmatimonadaceae bacterium]|nr:replicative DNA helicase [Gemmatimonadaceae bacterium]